MILSALVAVAVGMLVPVLVVVAWSQNRADQRWAHGVLEMVMPDVEPPGYVGVAVTIGRMMLMAVCFLIVGNVLGALVLWGVAQWGLSKLVDSVARRQTLRLESQIPDAARVIAADISANRPLDQALRSIASDAAWPLRQHLNHVLRRLSHGQALESVMTGTVSVGPASAGWKLFCQTVVTVHQVAGRDPRALRRLADSLQRIQEMTADLRAATAEGRTQLRIILLMPLILFAMLSIGAKEDLLLMMTTPSGRIVLALAAVLMIAGFVWIRLLVKQDL